MAVIFSVRQLSAAAAPPVSRRLPIPKVDYLFKDRFPRQLILKPCGNGIAVIDHGRKRPQ